MWPTSKDKINFSKHRERINKWCAWKSLCKSRPELYKIKIIGDEMGVTLMLLEFKNHSLEFRHLDPYWGPIEYMEWKFD